jgi:hypothetical protein
MYGPTTWIFGQRIRPNSATFFHFGDETIGSFLSRFQIVIQSNLPGTTDKYCLAHFFKKSRLWDTNNSAPLYLLQALINESTDSKSKKLVGSSRINKWGQ